MKPSSEWNRQQAVDEAADAIVAEGKATLATITAYQVAERLACSANPSVYRKFRDWHARRIAEAEAEPDTVDLPPEADATIRTIFSRLSDEGISACLGALRSIGSTVGRAAQLHIAASDRRVDAAKVEVETVLALGEKVENELRVAQARIEELQEALADAQRREDRLAGRLDQSESNLATALQHHTPAVAPTEVREGRGSDASDKIGESDGNDAQSTSDIETALNPGAAARTQLPLTFPGVNLDALDDDGGDDD